MIVGLLAMLFMLVSAFIVLARFERRTVQMVGQADQVTHILDSITDVAAGAIRGPSGSDLVSGANYVDIPGSGDPNDPNWGSPWLASAEPVHDPNATTSYLPGDYVLPVVSGFSGPADPNDPNIPSMPLTRLMLDANGDGTVTIQPVDPPTAANLAPYPDTIANARQPFADANGDGIPDSLFSGAGVLTELANAMGGRVIHAAGIDPSNLNPLDPNDLANYRAWQQFDSTARYAVAAQIISHGGMIQVSAPTSAVTWNSAFMAAMFNWVRHPSDPLNTPTLVELQAMGAQRGAVEPLLRKRGGLLVAGGGAGADEVPQALNTLQSVEGLQFTFIPSYVEWGRNNWQRFDLASMGDWSAWSYASSIDAVNYNQRYSEGNTIPARTAYVPRQILTTVNNSDELARIEIPKPPGYGGLGLPPGALKYYLGLIADPTIAPDGYPRGAFLNGKFNSQFPAGNPRGLAIVSALANYYSEMLAPYGGWVSDPNDPIDPNSNQAVTRGQQAYMLAVNTVAFAAPRVADPSMPGFVDNVWGTDGSTIYVGQAPQLYITQVMAYRQPDPNQPPDTHIALAVEIYNPGDVDPYAPGNFNVALPLAQYGVSVNADFDSADPNSVEVLSPASGFPVSLFGRSFLVFAINAEGSNTYFDPGDPNDPSGTQRPILSNLPVVPDGSDLITVKLWRLGSSGPGCVLVDRFTLQAPYNMGYDGSNPDAWLNWPGSYTNAWRDTNTEPYWGTDVNGKAARWRCTIALPHDKIAKSEADDVRPGQDPNDPNALAYLGTFGPDDPNFLAPCVPLYTMNADGNMIWLHGASRPASFPTVGFMLYVPRFAHTWSVSGTTLSNPKSASMHLDEQWEKWSQASPTGYGYTAARYPADLGHMPVFDNTQPRDPSSCSGTKKTGSIPWGQLVFDYFTTLDPNDPNDPIDPYRVPGRININDASWYVLSGLPVIGPRDATNPTTTDLPLDRSASPAFWSYASGILAGAGAVARYPGALLDARTASSGEWYRLGPYLAEAAVAYRDRTRYVSDLVDPKTTAVADAFLRNGGWPAYRPPYYGDPNDPNDIGGIRTCAGNVQLRGFLSIGELANVKGFDGSTVAELQTGATATVLGGYQGEIPNATGGDFMKAVSLLALLDTHFLTTRSNTFTVYTTLYDRENPQASVRSQMTVDRSNLLPRLVPDGTGGSVTLQNDGPPDLIARRDYSYFNSQYDQ